MQKKVPLLKWSKYRNQSESHQGYLGEIRVCCVQERLVADTLKYQVFSFLPHAYTSVGVFDTLAEAVAGAEAFVKMWIKKAGIKDAYNHSLI